MKIPKSETIVPGVECRTLHHGTYVITSNELRNKFTLWQLMGNDYTKIAINKSITALYDKVPWRNK